MGMYNILELALRCPHCGTRSELEAEFRFGLLGLDKYSLGSKLRWRERKGNRSERCPEGGHFTGEGYVECPDCHMDFWIVINVQNDVIENAKVDLNRKGYKLSNEICD